MKIIKAPATKTKVNMFRRGDKIYLDLDGEQYVFSLKEILALEDLDRRNTITKP